MINQTKNNKILYSALFIASTLLGVLFSYQYIFQTWFAMDEWSFWMHFLKDGPFYVIRSTGLIGSITGGARFGLDLTNGIFFSLFGLNITPWHITFLAIHLLNVFLLYKVLLWFKLAPFAAFFASFFFAISSAGYETLAWPAAGMQVLGSTFFILLSLLLTIKFLNTNKRKFITFALIFSYLSFLMRPTGIVTVALIGVLIFLFYKRSNLSQLPRSVVIFGMSAIILGVARLLIEYSDKLDVLIKAGFNVVFYPFISLSHIFIPFRLMFRLSDGFINFYYPLVASDSNVDTISHLIVGDYISTVLSIIVLFFINILYKKVGKFHKKVIIFGLFLFFIHYFVIAIYYVDRGGLSYLESRHTYTSIIGISIILGTFFNLIIDNFDSVNKIKKFLVITLFLLIGAWLYQEMTVTRREVRAQAIEAVAIRKTFESLQALNLPNSEKLVFYLESDRSYYYPEWRLPFKVPSAYMFPLAFYGRSFIEKSMLGELGDNNYIKSNNKQFGYFTDIDMLASVVEDGEINIDNIVGLYFIDGEYTFEITTKETHRLIENELESRDSDY
jgi:hypothetical protein